MKKSIAWHRQCLHTREMNLEYVKNELSRLKEKRDVLKSNIDFYRLQIYEAEQRGIEAFDRDKFLIHKKG